MTETHSFGNTLRLARERRGLSREEAAKALCLNVEIIVALENEQFDKLPSAVFVRGYIKSYASLLRLTINEPSSSSSSSSTVPVNPTARTVKKSPSGVGLFSFLGNIFVKALNYIVAIVLLLLVFIWWHERHHAIEKMDATRSIIGMSIQQIPFARPREAKVLPTFDKKDELIKEIFPAWPL